MSPALFGLSAAIAVVALVIAYAVVWTNRTPKVERDEDEMLPLFSGLGNGNALDSRADANLVAAAESRAQQAVAQAAARAVAQTASPQATSPQPASRQPASPQPASPQPASRQPAPSPPVARPEPRPASPPPPPPSTPVASPSFAPPSRIAAEFASETMAPTRTAIEHELIQYTLPTEGTLQFLPGRLEVAAGQDSGREIRFVRLPGPNGTEFTFGRSEGEPYRHIRLRDQTVSREHARMRFAAGRWYIQSLSQTNPVIYDGHALQHGEERMLEDGARLEMGEVLLAFRHR